MQLPIKIRPYKCCLYISIYLTINITILCLINTKKTQNPAIRWVFCIVSLACFLALRKIIFFIPIPHLAIPDFFQLLHKSHGNRAGSKNDRRNFKKAKSTLKFQCFKRAFIFKLVENTGVEPVTSWLPVMRAPSCANAPDPIPYIPFERKSSLPVYIRQTASGATGRDRTGHLHVTNVLLCQMSYSGMLKSIYWLTAWWYFTMLEKFRQYTTFIFCGDFFYFSEIF